MPRTSFNPDHVKSFKDFSAFEKWDDGSTPEDELNAVWAECVPAKVETIAPIVPEPKPAQDVTEPNEGEVTEHTKQGD